MTATRGTIVLTKFASAKYIATHILIVLQGKSVITACALSVLRITTAVRQRPTALTTSVLSVTWAPAVALERPVATTNVFVSLGTPAVGILRTVLAISAWSVIWDMVAIQESFVSTTSAIIVIITSTALRSTNVLKTTVFTNDAGWMDKGKLAPSKSTATDAIPSVTQSLVKNTTCFKLLLSFLIFRDA